MEAMAVDAPPAPKVGAAGDGKQAKKKFEVKVSSPAGSSVRLAAAQTDRAGRRGGGFHLWCA